MEIQNPDRAKINCDDAWKEPRPKKQNQYLQKPKDGGGGMTWHGNVNGGERSGEREESMNGEYIQFTKAGNVVE